MAFFTALSGVLLVYLLAAYIRAREKRLKAPLPPGPKRLPIIGNLLDVPADSVWLTFDKWFKHFQSDIVSVNVVGSNVMILNTYAAAVELLEKRSALYSSRPHLTMLMDMLDWGTGLPFLPYGDTWRKQRRLFSQSFNPTAAKSFQAQETKAAHRLLRRLIMANDSDHIDIMRYFRQFPGDAIMSIAYGIDILPDQDPFVALAEEHSRAAEKALSPGTFWVDFLPFLKYVPAWLPGAGFQRYAKETRKLVDALRDRPFLAAKKLIGTGNFEPSFVSRSLHKLSESAYYDEDTVKSVAGVMYGAAADTTLSTMTTAILGILLAPEIQKKAQAELDRVLKGSLPTFEDQDVLPYLTAIILEALRWNPVAPFGVAHLVTSEDIYKGYRIPEGTLCFPNVWSILHDEGMYPDPYSFNPDRFLKDGKLDPKVLDPRHVAFGFGRRICPGRYMAYSTIWIAVASLLATLEFTKATDKSGDIIQPSVEYKGSFLIIPKAFQCAVKPRSKEAIALIQAATSN